MSKRSKVLIWSFEHGAWWRPNSWGYTTCRSEAGWYDRAEAEKIVEQANWGGECNEKVMELGQEDDRKCAIRSSRALTGAGKGETK